MPNSIDEIPARPKINMPLKGYIIKENEEQIWIRDGQNTWLVDRGDVDGREAWSGVPNPSFSGTPVVLFIRDGADLHALRTVRVKAVVEVPFALAKQASEPEALDAAFPDRVPVTHFDNQVLQDAETGIQRMAYSYCLGPDGKKYICDNSAV